MKVAQINTHTYGGAAIVARRIHEALLHLQVDSRLITRYGVRGKIPMHGYFQDEGFRQFVRKNPFLFQLAKFVQEKFVHPNLANRPKGFELFSPLVSIDISSKFNAFDESDILHLHWISNFIPYELFFRRYTEKKFVWTLHDMNPFTGGCHYADGCLKFESVCAQCPQLKNTVDENYSRAIQSEKIAALKHLNDDQMVIVSPSRWLLELSKRSRATGRFRHVMIANPSFPALPVGNDRETIRRQLNLPLDRKIVLFACDNLTNPRKGVSTLFDAVRLVEKRERIQLVGIGNKAASQSDLDIIYTGLISDRELMSKFFYVADVFVTPSIAENSPLVVIEALTLGTPVVASAVGGVPELIHHDNGILFPAQNVEALAKAINQALFEHAFEREKILNEARAIHDPLKIASKYKEVYEALMAAR